MARKPRWEQVNFIQGVGVFRLLSWKYFSDFINQELLDYTTYVFRGQADAEWKLTPTIDRKIHHPESPKRASHLAKFKMEIRGRRGPNPPKMENENDYWALGQHHGLDTPLLDWTESPFVALYFAASFAYGTASEKICVFALSQATVRRNNSAITQDDEVERINKRKPTVKIFRPQSDENARLVSQRGLFTRGPNNMDLESWIRKFHDRDNPSLELIKITAPNSDLQNCLRYLNRMNINHSTLFPDLTGASEFCNRHLQINRY